MLRPSNVGSTKVPPPYQAQRYFLKFFPANILQINFRWLMMLMLYAAIGKIVYIGSYQAIITL
jgi:hypothetical protein